MSHALFERAAEGRHQAFSAGTNPADRVHPEVIEVMNEIGIDLSGRTPTCLTRGLAERADLVVTMGCGDECPVIPGTRYIDWDLQDPAGQPIATVRAIRDDISSQVENLIAQLDSASTDAGVPAGARIDTTGSDLSASISSGLSAPNVATDHAAPSIQVFPIAVSEPQVVALLDALTAELAVEGYTPEQTFGYTAEQLQTAGLYFVGARVDGRLVGVGGLELQEPSVGELKRFFVTPAYRGTGVADALLDALFDYARTRELELLRLETGDKQRAAIAFYERRGFVHIPRFGPYRSSQSSVCMQRRLAEHESERPRRT